MAAGIKNPQYIGDVGDHIGNQKSQRIADHRVSGPEILVDFSELEIEQPDQVIPLLQSWKQQPGAEMENDDMGNRRQTAGQAIFDELNQIFVVEHM